MDGLVRRLRKLLLAVSRTYGEDLNLVCDLQALHLKIQQENHEMGVLLRQCFLLFVVLTSTTPRSFSDPQYEDEKAAKNGGLECRLKNLCQKCVLSNQI